MEYAGLVVVAIVALVFCYLLPRTIDRRAAMVQSREVDRFSPGLRLLDSDPSGSGGRGGRHPQAGCPRGPSILPSSRATAITSGDPMSPQPFHARRPVLGAKDAHRLNDARREASRLRSRRAARLAVEQAGVRRRAVLAGVLGVAVAVLVVLPLMGVIGWAWVAIPSVLLVAVLGYSRAVASHSAKLRSEEESRMQELREVIAQLGSGASSRTIDEDAHGAGSASGAGAVRGAPADLSAVVEDAEASSDGAAGAEESADAGEAVISDAHDREEAVGEAPGDSGEVAADADSTEGAEAVHQSSPDAARRSGSRQWSVRRTPAPSYQAKPRVAGRQVHADTDIKGVPVVDPTRVPARPVDTSLFSGQSTAQVAASQPVSFDLDQVLDNRRAQ